MRVRIVGLIAVVLVCTASLATAGDRLAEALRLYDDTMYTRALEVLDAIADRAAVGGGASVPGALLHRAWSF